LGWKVFALFNILVACNGIVDPESYSLMRTLEVVMEVVSTIGLVLMAFKFNLRARNFCLGSLGPISPTPLSRCRGCSLLRFSTTDTLWTAKHSSHVPSSISPSATGFGYMAQAMIRRLTRQLPA
jgi:hypothetical protein